jgi:hypothetical protein
MFKARGIEDTACWPTIGTVHRNANNFITELIR